MSFNPWKNKPREAVSAETSPLLALRNEMDRLFSTYIREPLGGLEWPFAGQEKWLPAVDVSENDLEVVVRAEMPGLDPQDLDVSLSGSQLVLSGEKREPAEQTGKGYYHSEIRFGPFLRSVQLPEGVDAEHVDAQYANGVLTLRLKKSHATAPTRIEVKVKDREPAVNTPPEMG